MKAFLIIVTDRLKRLYIGAVIFYGICANHLFGSATASFFPLIVLASCSFNLALI